jgi:hypothetical protein
MLPTIRLSLLPTRSASRLLAPVRVLPVADLAPALVLALVEVPALVRVLDLAPVLALVLVLVLGVARGVMGVMCLHPEVAQDLDQVLVPGRVRIQGQARIREEVLRVVRSLVLPDRQCW